MTSHVESQFMVISNSAEVIAIRRIAKEMAHNIGFDECTREEISLVVSELASNIIKHAQRGIITLTPVCSEQCDGLMIEAEDDGEGFNEFTAMKDGFSTSGTLGIDSCLTSSIKVIFLVEAVFLSFSRCSLDVL